MDLNDTLGAMLIGAFVTMVIYGITTLQTYFYFYYYPKDSTGVKLLVTSIWILDTLHAIFMCHAIHFYLITGFGNQRALVEGTWSLYSSIAINVIMAFVVQAFFTQRIHQLSPSNKRWWISGIIGFAVLAHFAFGLETVVFFFIKKQFTRLSEATFISALPFGIFVVLSDVFIAVALCVLLDSNRSEYEDTNNLINKLIVFAVNRCILTSVVAIVELIVFIQLPHSFYSFAFDFVIGKLYANSLLATLNSRLSLRNERELFNSTGVSTSFNLVSLSHNDTDTRTQIRGLETCSCSTDDRVGLVDKESRQSTTASSRQTAATRRSYANANV